MEVLKIIGVLVAVAIVGGVIYFASSFNRRHPNAKKMK